MSTLLQENNAVTPVTTTKDLTKEQRIVRSWVADLAGSRKSLMRQQFSEVVSAFCKYVFEDAMNFIKDNPFRSTAVSVVLKSDFDDFDKIVEIINKYGDKAVSEEVTNLVMDLGVEYINIEVDSPIITITIRFKD